MEYEVFRFRDIATLINGRAYLMSELQDEGKYRIVRVGNFTGKDEWFYSDMELDEDKYCHKGDLLYKWACTFGPEIWKEEKTIYHYHIWKVIPKAGFDKGFLYYYLKLHTPYWLGGTNGATMVHITKSSMENKKVSFPSYENQCEIADILSTYDELIENNNRRITLLEKAAQELYKEWFVRFRFPGYENAEFENGIPKGWKIKRLSDYGRVETGKTPSTEIADNYGEEYMFVKTPDMHGNVFTIHTSEYLSQQGHFTQPKKLLPFNSIMVSCIGTGGVVSINAEQAHTNQQINSIILKNPLFLEWLFFTCKSLKETIELFGATGATMTNLSKGKFEKLKVISPTESLVLLFHDKVNYIFEEIKSLMYQNRNLTKQRDLLLPRLMSGKLEV